jgi:hypothetical protein
MLRLVAFKYSSPHADPEPAAISVSTSRFETGKMAYGLVGSSDKCACRNGFMGTFLAGFLGASIPFFPSYVAIPLMATRLNPIAVGVISGVGQYLHYYVGFGGRYLFSTETRARFDRWRVRFKKYGAWLIVFMAATPLTPDDAVWIPLGLIGYPKAKALVAGITGKIVLGLVYACAGYYGWPMIDQWFNLKPPGSWSNPFSHRDEEVSTTSFSLFLL